MQICRCCEISNGLSVAAKSATDYPLLESATDLLIHEISNGFSVAEYIIFIKLIFYL
jgi:hypothetical protein